MIYWNDQMSIDLVTMDNSTSSRTMWAQIQQLNRSSKF
jgi:hypothetical protein